MQPAILEWIGFLWIVFLVVWGIGALAQKRTVRRESAGSRLVQVLLTALAVVLLWGHGLGFGPLARPFVPRSLIFLLLGLALTVAGLAFAISARVVIGRNWSGVVTVKKDHELIRNGPYALVRHPIYTGVLLALLGTAMAFAEVRGLLAVAVATLALWMKSRREELFMIEEFGAEYAQYKQKVKALIPFVW
ncbi:MAG: isoprenylcysteine carboxylmethyltransferase family protein [Acidobacteriota bacterium]